LSWEDRRTHGTSFPTCLGWARRGVRRGRARLLPLES